MNGSMYGPIKTPLNFDIESIQPRTYTDPPLQRSESVGCVNTQMALSYSDLKDVHIPQNRAGIRMNYPVPDGAPSQGFPQHSSLQEKLIIDPQTTFRKPFVNTGL